MRPQTPWIFRPAIFRNMWWMRQATAPSKNALEVAASHNQNHGKKTPVQAPYMHPSYRISLCSVFRSQQRSTGATHRFPKTWSNHLTTHFFLVMTWVVWKTRDKKATSICVYGIGWYHGIPLLGMIEHEIASWTSPSSRRLQSREIDQFGVVSQLYPLVN